MSTAKCPGRWLALLVSLVAVAPACTSMPPSAAQPAEPRAPAAQPDTLHEGVVAADHGQASDIGAAILAVGGTAADAGVATLLALGVLNPFASGLGGGGFCLYRSADTGRFAVLDFREVAPRAAHRDFFIVDGRADTSLSQRGGKAVGVPGEARGLAALHQRFGRLPWQRVVAPAHRLAEEGFEVEPLLEKRLSSKADELATRPALAALFREEDGSLIDAGDKLRRPKLARALALLRDQGADSFYTGPVGRAIIEAVNYQGGAFSAGDLAGYQPRWREPLMTTYRDDYEVYSMPPPSSGGVALIEALNILEGFNLAGAPDEASRLHLIAEAMKHAFADRARWLGDADFVEVPVERLTSKQYARRLRERVDPQATMAHEAYGSDAPPPDDGGTSHVSIIDPWGNMLACTSTINTSFGSMVVVPEYGLVLNNEMDDFSAQPGVPNAYALVGNEQNAVAAGKRPLSSMTPTLVLRDGRPFLAVGASGGPTIITGTLLAILNLIDGRLEPDQVLQAPRIHHQWLPEALMVEGPLEQEVRQGLEARGHVLRVVDRAPTSVQIVVRQDLQQPDAGAAVCFVGASDPRKGGRPATAPAPTQGGGQE